MWWIDNMSFSVIWVENSKDNEPILSINKEELEKALELSSNPDSLRDEITSMINSINNQTDEYLKLSFFDDWKFSAEDVDATKAMQEIAIKINNYFNNFHNDEKASTDSLKSNLSSLKWKEITGILDLYRDPVIHEKAQQKMQKMQKFGVINSQSEAMYAWIGSKRQI